MVGWCLLAVMCLVGVVLLLDNGVQEKQVRRRKRWELEEEAAFRARSGR